MIYVRLAGGLGNQLFQLAAASLLASRTGMRASILTSGLSRYSLSRAPDCMALVGKSSWIQDPSKSSFTELLVVKCRTGLWMPTIGINDRTFETVLRRPPHQGPLFVDGYFQKKWNFDTFNEALQGFELTAVSNESKCRTSEKECHIHIRGGDFLKIKKYQVADETFYLAALALAFASGWEYFAILTDDMFYAKALTEKLVSAMPHCRFRIVPRAATALDDFDTLRSAPARIIGNSTFGWWAAALGCAAAPTWAPTMLTTDEPKDFFLPWERPVVGRRTLAEQFK